MRPDDLVKELIPILEPWEFPNLTFLKLIARSLSVCCNLLLCANLSITYDYALWNGIGRHSNCFLLNIML